MIFFVRLNKGTLAPDLDKETYKDKVWFNHYNTKNVCCLDL